MRCSSSAGGPAKAASTAPARTASVRSIVTGTSISSSVVAVLGATGGLAGMTGLGVGAGLAAMTGFVAGGAAGSSSDQSLRAGSSSESRRRGSTLANRGRGADGLLTSGLFRDAASARLVQRVI